MRSPVQSRRTRLRAAVAVLVLLISGCSFFSRSKSRFYSLEQIPPPGGVANVRGLPVAIDGIELPPGFDRREIVVRKPDRQLEVRSTEQWSASLQPLVLHTLAFDLASRLPQGMVILPGEVKPTGATRSVDVVFAEIAAGPESQVVVDAQIVVHTSGTTDATRRERIAIDVPSLNSVDVAAGMSRAVAALADRIAAMLF